LAVLIAPLQWQGRCRLLQWWGPPVLQWLRRVSEPRPLLCSLVQECLWLRLQWKR